MALEEYKLVVEAVSKFGFKSGEIWYNYDKEKAEDLKSAHKKLERGDTIIGEKNGKYIHSMTIGEKGEILAPKASEPKPSNNPPVASKTSLETRSHSPEVQAQIRRGNACNAVLGSPILPELLRDLDIAQSSQLMWDLISKVEHYISSGDWVNK